MLIKDGVLGVKSDNDFLIGSITIPNLELQDNIIYEYSQGSTNDCTIYNAMGCLSDLFNYKFYSGEIEDINELSYDMGRNRGKGRWTYKGFDCVRKRRNSKYPDKRVLSFRVDIGSEDFLEAIGLGYSIGCTYRGNGKYNRDFKDDGILQGKRFGTPTYGHATRSKKRKRSEDHHVKIIDSYEGRKYNIYEIPDLEKLVDTKVFYPWAYMFVPEKKIPKTKEQLRWETIANLTKKLNHEFHIQTHKIQQTHEINYEEAENLKNHLSETNSVIRSIVL